jgi:hypothetical protein
MGNIHLFLPKLTLNKLFVRDLMAADPPCFAMGYVEERGSISGFLAMRPDENIPQDSTQQGFCFGHSMLGIGNSQILHFAFEFYGHATYNSLVNPENPIVQSVLTTMIQTKDYFFFAINPDQTVTAFRSKLEHSDLAGIETNQKRFKKADCTTEQYEKAFNAFSKNPDPPGQVMKWVCRDNPDYLNLSEHRLELNPRHR